MSETYDERYDRTWGTPIGQDCINLDVSLTRWLGERLMFMGAYTQSYPSDFENLKAWQVALQGNATRLLAYADAAAQDCKPSYEVTRDSLRWVAEYLPALWD